MSSLKKRVDHGLRDESVREVTLAYYQASLKN